MGNLDGIKKIVMKDKTVVAIALALVFALWFMMAAYFRDPLMFWLAAIATVRTLYYLIYDK